VDADRQADSCPFKVRRVFVARRFSPDGTLLLTSAAKSVHLWSEDFKPLATLTHDDSIRSAVFAPDGRRILTASETARLWSVDGALLKTLAGHGNLRKTGFTCQLGDSVVTYYN
jgi:WD40 repeat protein